MSVTPKPLIFGYDLCVFIQGGKKMESTTVAHVRVAEKQRAHWFGIIIGVIVFGWVFLLHVYPSLLFIFKFGFGLQGWRLLSLIILGVVALGELGAYARAKTTTPVIEEKTAEREEKKIYEYPPKVTGVIYADTYIPIEENVFLKVRSMLARSCKICYNREECWEKAREKMSEEEFLSNMECKEGLREKGVAI